MTSRTLELSVVVVTWNSAHEIEACLRSVTDALEREGISGEVVVVDNASTDDTLHLAEGFRGPLRVVPLEQNIGFGRANNVGAAEAHGRVLLFLNPDTAPDPGCLSTAMEALDGLPLAGMVGCKLYNERGTQASTFSAHTLGRDVARLTGVGPLIRSVGRLFSQQPTRRVGGVVGAFMMMRADTFEAVGGFSENIFLYGEDVELCYRVTSAGYRVYYVPDATCFHAHNASNVDDRERYSKHYAAIRDFYARHQSQNRYAAFVYVLLLTYPFRQAGHMLLGLFRPREEERRQRERVYAQQAAADLLGEDRSVRGLLARPPLRAGLVVATLLAVVLAIVAPVYAAVVAAFGVFYSIAVHFEPRLERLRIDVFSPWVAYPLALAGYYFVGLLLPLNYVGGRLPASQMGLYLVGIAAYAVGVLAAGATMTLPRKSQERARLRESTLQRVRLLIGAGLAACAFLLFRFGYRGGDYRFRFAGAPGWTFYLLFLLIAGVFSLALIGMWKPMDRRALIRLVALSFVTIVAVTALGSRSPLFIAAMSGAIAFHYVVSHFRPRKLIALGLVAFLTISLLGFVRLATDPSRAEWYTRNAIKYGIPASAVPLAPGLLALRNGAGHLELIRQTYPSKLPYMYGQFSVMSLATLAPGKQPLPGHVLTEVLFDRPIEEMGGVAPGILGGFYVDGGVTGIAIGMFVIGVTLGAAHRWMTSRYSLLSVATYCVVLANYLLWIYGNFLTNPTVLWFLLLILFAFWPASARHQPKHSRNHRRATGDAI